MDKQDEEATVAENEAREARRRRDFDDLNNEMAGRETGRARRFLPPSQSEKALREKREREAEQLSRLARLMQDPEYAALRNEAIDQLRLYELAAERALADAIARGDQDEIDSIRHYQVEVLGHARDRLYDDDDAATKDEIRELQEGLGHNVPASVAKQLDVYESGPAASPADIFSMKPPPM